MRTFLGDRGLDLATMDEETHDRILALVIWGDPDEVGERLTDVLEPGRRRLHLLAAGQRPRPRPRRAARPSGDHGAQRLSSLTGRQVCDHAAMEFGLFLGGFVHKDLRAPMPTPSTTGS